MNDNTNDQNHFQGCHVAAFESRRADELQRMIEKQQGIAFVAPSMREVALSASQETSDFAHRLITGQVDIVLLMTGVGTKYLVEQVARQVDQQQFINALSDVITIARGPKPVAVLKDLGIEPTYRAEEPNTWREMLDLIDQNLQIANQRVSIQEYGLPNASLIAGLEARGANIEALKVYRWDLPEDTLPLEENVRRIASGEIDMVLFTSSQQIHHALKIAESLDLEDDFYSQLRSTVVCSIGPTMSETLAALEIPVDLQPEHPKMGHLVAAAAGRAEELIRRKKEVVRILEDSDSAPIEHDPQAPWYNSPFMRACRMEPTDVTPIWLMRQAGRYMAEYREVRGKVTFLELCKNPQLCSEIMLTAVEKLNVDAAIIFSDLLPILEPMGLDLEFAKGEGPVIHNPLREAADVDRLIELESVDSLHFVMETVKQTRKDLPPKIPLIGFSGCPFTLASYAIEGGASRNYLHTKTLMYRDRAAWDQLMGRFSRAIVRYLNAQIAAGAQVVQLFDSWVGCLSVDDYRDYVLPYMKALIAGITPGVPVIHFGTGNPALLPLQSQAGSSVVGADWRIPLSDAWKAIGHDKAIQGNLDPTVLLGDVKEIRRQAKKVLDQADGRAGHIFNLGHGVLQQTPVENAIALIEAVHEMSSR